MNASVYWLTGISGAGKSTIAEAVRLRLIESGIKIKVIDGDDVRSESLQKIGYSKADVMQSNLNICRLIEQTRYKYDVILVSVIAPYEIARAAVAEKLGKGLHFIYCNTNIETATARDTKGLYKLSREGKINDLIGVNDSYPYEVPISPQITLPTNETGKINVCVELLIYYIKNTSYISFR